MILNAHQETWLEVPFLPQFICTLARSKMANISFDSQVLFCPPAPTSGKPTDPSCCLRGEGPRIASPGGRKPLRQDAHDNQHCPPAPSMVNVVEISSDSESDYGDLGEVGSDTSFPPIDELFPPFKQRTQSGSVAGTSS